MAANDKMALTSSQNTDLITNGSMEVDSDWNDNATPTTNEQSNEQVHGGIYSRKFVGNAQLDGITQDVSSTSGNIYLCTVWIYISALTATSVKGFWNANSVSAQLFETSTIGSWEKQSFVFTADSTGAFNFRVIQIGAGAVTCYVDDVSIQKYVKVDVPDGTYTVDAALHALEDAINDDANMTGTFTVIMVDNVVNIAVDSGTVSIDYSESTGGATWGFSGDVDAASNISAQGSVVLD